jgi:small subunit ribosomal protein S15
VGSSEVQIELLSNKIVNLSNHFKKNKNDKHSTRGLLKAVNQRKRLLEYLKRENPESYTKILTKLDLRK